MNLEQFMRMGTAAVFVLLVPRLVAADILISANEGKYDLSSGRGTPVQNPPPDSLTILDFATMPPRARHVLGIANSVLGPPSNVALTPDERLALVANSIRHYTQDPKQPAVDDRIQIVDPSADPPRQIATVRVGRQPSGLAIDRTGKLALVANRGDGTVSLLSIDGAGVRVVQTLRVSAAGGEPSGVAFNPAGTLALVSINREHVVRMLSIAGGRAELSGHKLPVYGLPYHVQVTPDGHFALVAGGSGLPGPHADAISVIDLGSDPPRTVDHVTVGTGPESFDISPDGSLVAVVLMNGSNLAADDPQRTEHGALDLLRREGARLERVQHLAIGRIPEGVTFTPDGRYLVVQLHAARELAIYGLRDGQLHDTGTRIAVPGFPSALRRADRAPR